MSEKLLFAAGSVHGNVSLASSKTISEQFVAYANQFAESATYLANYLETSSGYSDLEACPIVYLFRHSLELYFKAIALKSHDLLFISHRPIFDKNELFGKNGHSLKFLFNYVKIALHTILQREWPSDIDGLPTWDQMLALISELEDIDAASTTFRYPIDRNGKPSKASNFIFNIVDFTLIIKNLCNFLDGFYEELNTLYDNFMENLSAY